jgi:hypothetical protein
VGGARGKCRKGGNRGLKDAEAGNQANQGLLNCYWHLGGEFKQELQRHIRSSADLTRPPPGKTERQSDSNSKIAAGSPNSYCIHCRVLLPTQTDVRGSAVPTFRRSMICTSPALSPFLRIRISQTAGVNWWVTIEYGA